MICTPKKGENSVRLLLIERKEEAVVVITVVMVSNAAVDVA